MPLAQITGSAVYFDDVRGEKTPVLLLHAFPLNREMWAPQIEALAKQGHRVISFDARGFGKTGPATRVTAMSLIADDAASLMRHLGIERAIIAGCSMGGYAAFEFARRHAPWLAGLVLADTRAGADTFEAKQKREEFAKTAVEKGLAWVADEMTPKLVREKSPVAPHIRELILGGTPDGVAAAQRGMAAREDMSALLPQIKVPALILVGEDDKLTPPAESEAMAKAIPNAKLVKIPNAAHISNLENPGAFNDALLPFVRAL